MVAAESKSKAYGARVWYGKNATGDTPLWALDTPESEPGNLCLPTTAGCLAAGLGGNAAST